MEIPSQICRRRLGGIATIANALFGAQKLNGQRVRLIAQTIVCAMMARLRSIKAFRVAKIYCDRLLNCNRFTQQQH